MEEETTSPSTSTILIRISFFTFLLFISIYADYESSKHFDVSVSVTTDSYLHRKFNLLFISNGRASRILLESNTQLQKILLYPKNLKHVRHVHIQLANHDLDAPVMVYNGYKLDTYVITISPSLMMEKDVVKVVEKELRKAMARVLMWEQKEEMVESLADSGAKEDMIRLWLEKKLTIGKDCEDCVAKSAVGSRQVI